MLFSQLALHTISQIGTVQRWTESEIIVVIELTRATLSQITAEKIGTYA